eukprot:UN14958
MNLSPVDNSGVVRTHMYSGKAVGLRKSFDDKIKSGETSCQIMHTSENLSAICIMKIKVANKP